jgi:hypothetical protein
LTHVAVTIAITQLGRESVYCLLKLVYLVLTHVAVTPEGVCCISKFTMPNFDAHCSYTVRNRECLLHKAVRRPDFDARRSYDRSYPIEKRECLLPIAVSMPDFDAYRN